MGRMAPKTSPDQSHYSTPLPVLGSTCRRLPEAPCCTSQYWRLSRPLSSRRRSSRRLSSRRLSSPGAAGPLGPAWIPPVACSDPNGVLVAMVAGRPPRRIEVALPNGVGKKKISVCNTSVHRTEALMGLGVWLARWTTACGSLFYFLLPDSDSRISFDIGERRVEVGHSHTTFFRLFHPCEYLFSTLHRAGLNLHQEFCPPAPHRSKVAQCRNWETIPMRLDLSRISNEVPRANPPLGSVFPILERPGTVIEKVVTELALFQPLTAGD